MFLITCFFNLTWLNNPSDNCINKRLNNCHGLLSIIYFFTLFLCIFCVVVLLDCYAFICSLTLWKKRGASNSSSCVRLTRLRLLQPGSPGWRTNGAPRSLGHRPAGRLVPLLAEETVVVDTSQATMATEVRQELAQLMNSSGSHKDLAAKYVYQR